MATTRINITNVMVEIQYNRIATTLNGIDKTNAEKNG